DARYVWGMTGSPTPTEPTDAYGLARLITPRTAPHSYLHFSQAVMKQIDKWRWVPKHDAAETVARVLQPATRYTLEDIIELPPVIERDVRVGMGPRQWAAYDQLKDHMATLLKDGMITAANGGVLYSKLLQISLGWVYDEDKGVHALDNGARIDALLDIIESVVDTTDTTRKVIVFSAFKSATAGIAEALEKECIEFATVTGDTSMNERTKIFHAFQNTPRYPVLNAHPECMSHGLTLTAADTIVWFGPITKFETYEQANARISRVSQTRKQQI